MRMMQTFISRRLSHLSVGLMFTLFYVILFSPAWLNGFLLAPEDSFFDYAPRFCLGFTEWTDLIFGGFPLRSDPQQASFYPLRILFCSLGSWNAYVIAAYILASFFTYLFISEHTESRWGAIIAGFVFGCSGYLLRFVHMQALVQAIIWLPLILWSLERMRRGPSLQAIVIGSIAIAMSCFGGHPQMFFYSVTASVFYALIILAHDKDNRKSLVFSIGAMFVLGLALAAPQWMSTLDYMRYTNRAAQEFSSFTLNAWHPVEWARLFVPSAFSLLNTEVWQGYTGCTIHTLQEEHVSTGLLALVLAMAGILVYRRSSFVWFWGGISVFSILMAFGSTTFFGEFAYHLPGYNLFRVPSRHMIFFVMAVCVLVGYFFRSLEECPRRALRASISASLTVGFFYVTAIWLLHTNNCLSYSTRVFWISTFLAFLTFIAVPIVVYVWPRVKGRGRTGLFLMLLSLCLIDMVQGGWFRFGFIPALPWPQPVAMNANKHELLSLPKADDFDAPLHAHWIKKKTEHNHTRIWSSRGKMAGRAGLLNNVSMGWGLPNIGGYSPLAPTPILDVMEMIYGGTALSDWWRSGNQALSLASVEYVTVPRADDNLISLGNAWFRPVPFQHSIGPEKKEISYWVENATPIKEIVIDTVLTDMSGVLLSGVLPEGTLVATLAAFYGEREVQSWSLRYGQSVRHAAAHCLLPARTLQEGATPAVLGMEISLDGKPCSLMQYIWKGQLDKPSKIGRLVLTYHAPVQSLYRVLRLSLVDETDGVTPIAESLQALDINASYERVASVDNALIYRNKTVRPRAYFVQDVLGGLSYKEQLHAIHTGILPSGSFFDGQTQALTESETDRHYDPKCTSSSIKWLEDTPLEIKLSSVLQAPCFLVLADGYYKNWHVLINGEPAVLEKTNAAFRGVEVPSGEHEITFGYVPSIMNRIGDGLGLAALLALVVLSLFPFVIKRGPKHG